MMTCLRRCAMLCSFMILTACATTRPYDQATYDASLQAAEKLAEQGQTEQAVAALQDLSVRNPDRVEPWAYIARLRFEEKKYSLAVVAAEEALARSPSDAGTRTVLASSAMHVAAGSIDGLKGNGLFIETTRGAARTLAQALRKTYGDEDLFPSKRAKPRRTTRPVVSKPVDPGQGAGATPLAPPAAAAGGGGGSPNPFGNLMNQQ